MAEHHWRHPFAADVFFYHYCVWLSKFHIISQISSGSINTHSVQLKIMRLKVNGKAILCDVYVSYFSGDTQTIKLPKDVKNYFHFNKRNQTLYEMSIQISRVMFDDQNLMFNIKHKPITTHIK